MPNLTWQATRPYSAARRFLWAVIGCIAYRVVMRRILVALCNALFLVLFVHDARAQAPTTSKLWDDFAAEEKAIAAATFSECIEACKALDSLTRAADALCAADADRCREAQERVRAASMRVLSQCPQCASARKVPSTPPPNAPKVDEAKAGDSKRALDSDAPATTRAEVASVNAPKRGGCASCSQATTTWNDGAGGLWLLTATVAVMRRRLGTTRPRT
jgi:hypothetical protein